LAAQSTLPLDRHVKISNSPIARWFACVSELLTKALYPLSADPLLTLTTYNVVRGLVLNLIILGAESPAYCETVHSLKRRPGQNLPPDLMPTPSQGKLHPAWIDVFPAPKIRDNIIEHLGEFDEDELCDELLGGICSDESNKEIVRVASLTENDLHFQSGRPGLILWSDPWDVRGWEVTPSFLSNWAWVLAGCTEILESTNRWRAMRDEAPIFHPDTLTPASRPVVM
jgi:Domain of unknown function (DUF3425)